MYEPQLIYIMYMYVALKQSSERYLEAASFLAINENTLRKV